MVVKKLWWFLISLVFCDYCVGWLDERYVLRIKKYQNTWTKIFNLDRIPILNRF